MKTTIPLFLNIILLIITFDSLQAQDQTATLPAKDFKEAKIEQYAEQILSIEDDQKRLKLNKELIALLNSQLTQKGAFSYPFNWVSSMAILTSPDSLFRLFNWSVPLNNGSHRYECILLQRDKNGQTKINRLNAIQVDTLDIPLEELKGNQNQWPQALYYELFQKKTVNRTYYTLLAFDAHNRLTKRKWIEVFWFDRKGELQIGAPIFKHSDKRRIVRPVFRYGAQNKMKMSYDEKQDWIILDHLSPSSSSLEGVYEYYGADFSFDAYQWDDNAWIHQADINVDKGLKKKKKDFKLDKDQIKDQEPIYDPN